jgi:thiamine pyrophosphate-dependent acetolactate synthase large subunit-like protein
LPRWREQQDAERSALIASAPDTQPIHPGRMIRDVCREIPDDAVLVRDGGCTSLWEFAYNEIRQRDYLWTSNFGHLGVGLPYAIGAQLAVGASRRVVLISGDSSFQFHIAELETAVRKRLPIVCVINSDAAWGMEHVGFRNAFGRDRDVEVRWGDVRFDLIAQGYGAHGEHVSQTKDIAPAMRRALAAQRPAVVQIATDPEVNAFQAPNWREFVSWYGTYY